MAKRNLNLDGTYPLKTSRKGDGTNDDLKSLKQRK